MAEAEEAFEGGEESRQPPRLKDDDVEDDAEDASQGEEDDVMVAVPTKKHAHQLEGFFARIQSSSEATPPCEKCRSVDTVEVIAVSAPYADLAERMFSVIVCKQCRAFGVLRTQKAAEEVPVPPETAKPEGVKAPLFEAFDATEAPTDDQLEALMAAVSVSKSEAKSSKGKSASKGTKKQASSSRLYEFVSEPLAEDDDATHERALVERYNKEARELGEDTFEVKAIKAERANSPDEDTFIARLQLEPQQRVRYYYRGQPLVPSVEALRNVQKERKCDACGARRTFEFQIMPQAITDIEKLLGVELDFSTILVFTCSRSCDEGSREECLVCPSV
jgi:hypothetical protein